MISEGKPSVFIGSSSESLRFAEALRDQLIDVAVIDLWTEAFKLGESTIEGLFRQLNRADYAILIATGDDLVKARGDQKLAPRDNVIFEVGLFMGRLGRRRAFILCDTKARPKLPSDLAGVTYATFDSASLDLKGALQAASAELRKIISSRHHTIEVDFIRAYLTIIHQDVKLSHTYADILQNHLQTLISEVERLKTDNEWDRLVEVKTRIREFFEYSGRYEDGARLGAYYVLAFQELGKRGEALWSQVKDVAYMLILADRHQEGRAKLNQVIEEAKTEEELVSRRRLLFYAYRYMGISFMRGDSRDLNMANHYFGLAGEQLQELAKVSCSDDALMGRLERNLGNLDLERNDHAEALRHYGKSLELFIQANDHEHIGITHLAIAKALIKERQASESAQQHLAKAQKIFARIGWIEGQGRVQEQRALEFLQDAKKFTDRVEQRKMLETSLQYAENAKAMFARIQHHRMMGRIDRIIEQILEELEE